MINKKQRENKIRDKKCNLRISGEQMEIGELVDDCSKCKPQIDIAIELLGANLFTTQTDGCVLTAVCPTHFLFENGRCV